MNRLQKVITIILASLVFFMLTTSLTFAQNTADGGGGGTVQEKEKDGSADNLAGASDKADPKSNSLYDKYSFYSYQMDQLDTLDKAEDGKSISDRICDSGFGSILKSVSLIGGLGCTANSVANGAADAKEALSRLLTLSWAFNYFSQMIWNQYITIAYFLIHWISWAFSLEVVTHILNAYQVAINRLEQTIWKPFMYLMWAVSVCWLVYFWISGKGTKLWSTLTSSLIIIALSSTIFTNLPSYLQTLSNASTDTSVTILAGLSDLSSNDFDPANGKSHRDQALANVESSLAGIFLKLPFQIIEFGSMKFSKDNKFDGKNENWATLLSKGGNLGDRKSMIQDAYSKEDDKGKEKYIWFLPDKAIDRFVTVGLTSFVSFAGLCCFTYIALLTIIWQFIALGRGLLAALYLLMGLWPGYGMKEAAQWGWSLIQAMFMKVFYTIILAIYINMVVALADQADEIGVLNVWWLAIGIFIGLILALKELRQKLTNIPLGNGMFLKGATNEAEQVFDKAKDLANKAAGYGTAIAGAAMGNPGLAKAGLSMAKGGLSHAIQHEGKQGIEKLAKTREASKDAKKDEKDQAKAKQQADNAADAAFENRLDGLSEEDAQFTKDVRKKTGLDLTTQQGRDAYAKLDANGAKSNEAMLNRIQANAAEVQRNANLEFDKNSDKAFVQTMAREMPKEVPAQGTAEYARLAQKFGAENVELWRGQQQNEVQRVNASLEMQQWNALPKLQRFVTPKPRISTANIQKGFETQFVAQQAMNYANNLKAQQAAAQIDYTPPLQSITVPVDMPIDIKYVMQASLRDASVSISDADWMANNTRLEKALEDAKKQLKTTGLAPEKIKFDAVVEGGVQEVEIELKMIQKLLGKGSATEDLRKALQSKLKSSDASRLDNSADKISKELNDLLRKMQTYSGSSFDASAELKKLGFEGKDAIAQLKDFLKKTNVSETGSDEADIREALKVIRQFKETLKKPKTPPSGGGGLTT